MPTLCPNLAYSLHSGRSSREGLMLPANSESGPGAVLPRGAVSETCEGLIYSSRIKYPLELATSQGLFTGCPALLCPWPLCSSLHLPRGGPVRLRAGPCPVPASWHTMLGWCSLWKPLERRWPLYDRNTTRTFPKGAVCRGGLSTDFPTRVLEQVQCRIATVTRREQMTVELSNSSSLFPLQTFDLGGSIVLVCCQGSCTSFLRRGNAKSLGSLKTATNSPQNRYLQLKQRLLWTSLENSQENNSSQPPK